MPDLKGPGGNAFVLLGQADRVLKKLGMDKEERGWFHEQAKASDYEHLLATIMEWFIVVAPQTTYVVINDAVEELGKSSSEKEE